MTKADIARIVYERHGGISNREAAQLLDIPTGTVKSRLARARSILKEITP